MILIIKHAVSEGPGLLLDFFRNHQIKTQIIELEKGERLPLSLKGIDAIVSMGGPMNAYDEKEYPFLKFENMLFKKAFENKVPVLGICLGAQLMSKALGGSIKKAKEKEIGWEKIELNCNGIIDPIFQGIDSVIDVFQYHEDEFSVPENASLLAINRVCPQAFRFGRNSYAFQFHIEVTPKMIELWMDDCVFKVDKLKVISTTYERKEKFENQMLKILSNYLKIINTYERVVA